MKDMILSSAKRLFPVLLAVAAIHPAHAQSSSLLSEAQRDYVAGNIAEAKDKFEVILASDPKNVAARNYLKAIATAEAQAGPGAKTETQYKKLILPQVQIQDATLDSALEYLKQAATKASNGALKPSFVLQPGVNASTPVTLRLSGIPFTEALKYVGDLASVQFSYDQYAISVRPKAGAISGAAPVEAPAAEAP